MVTHPGSTTRHHGDYSALEAPPEATSFTVKSNGETRFCKKCRARKPDRAHHCSTCRRCVLKMDHHCPWLATCIGLRNHKAFILFLVYTTLFCWYAFFVSGSWLWAEIINNTTYVQNLTPVNYAILAVISGIIGVVVGAFTIWHLILAARGQTTIECLEKTRYLSPLRRSMRNNHFPRPGAHPNGYGQQLLDIHANALPGITRPEEGVEVRPDHDPRPAQLSYGEHERQRTVKRYEEYMDEQDSEKMPNAFDLGWRRNYTHLFGLSPWLWALPVCNTTGDGWSWEASPAWIAARDRIRAEREEQRAREVQAGWGAPESPGLPPAPPAPPGGAGRHYLSAPPPPPRRTPSKADRVLGRDPDLYSDGVSLRTLNTRGQAVADDDLFSDDDAPEDAPLRPAPAPQGVRLGSWQGGASGLLRKGAPSPGPKAKAAFEDDDTVD